MMALYRKELNQLFSGMIGYIALAVFLVTAAMFLFLFPGGSNIFETGQADLQPFFDLAPLLFIFLIPALTMRSFAEEKSSGTIEFLGTKPVSSWQTVVGKYLAVVTLQLLAILPTLVFVWVISALALPAGDIDTGSIAGSYIGLFLLASCFSAVGIFTSALSGNQIIAFILGLFFSFFSFYAFSLLSALSRFRGSLDYYIDYLGLQSHYLAISRGVVDTRDLIFFVSFALLFLFATKTVLDARRW